MPKNIEDLTLTWFDSICLAEAAALSDSLFLGRRVQIYLLTYFTYYMASDFGEKATYLSQYHMHKCT